MPRHEFSSQVLTTPKGMATVAAARRLAGGRVSEDKKPRNDTGWQDRAWKWYDVIGEFRFACAWVGNVLSRAELEVNKNGKRVASGDAVDALHALFGGREGQKEMFRQLGIQFTVAGEAYVIGEDGGETPGDKWWIAAASELTLAGETWKIGKRVIDNPLVIRLWRPHPRVNNAPDAPARAVLPILSEIDGLTKHVAAQIDSRLAGAGILLLPDNISFATAATSGEDGDGLTGGLDPFLEELMETMLTAIKDREDASALVPILLQANGEHLDKVRHLTFSTPLDEQAIELRKEAIHRLALGMDMPPEVLTGTGDVNHWGAWQIEDAAIKSHTEPLLQVIVSSLNEGYLWPYLEAGGMDEETARQYSFEASTAKMRLRPDRSKEALELYDRAILSGRATMIENGFNPNEEMDEKERIEFFKRKAAMGLSSPELVAAALNLLGVPLEIEVEDGQIEDTQNNAPSLEEHPDNSPPDINARRHVRTEEQAIAEVVIFRALERAGNRIKSKYRGYISMGAENVPPQTLYRFTQKLKPEEIDDVLHDAWSCLASLPPISIPAQALDDYVRMLFATNRPHDSRTFLKYLAMRDVA